MQSFISKVVADIFSKNIDLANTTIVLPSNRAGLFVKEAFKQQSSKTILLPTIISIENFIAEIAQLIPVSNTHLLFEFYEIYKNSSPEKLESFDQFYEWGTIALNDFNEIDRHLIHPEQLFKSLADVKRIDDWTPQTPLISNYLNFFNYLHKYYYQLYDALLAKKTGYQGMMYREAIQNLQHFINNNQNKYFVFAGFNALNKSEEVIFQELLEHNLASVYWDINQTFFNSPFEIGYFLKKYKKEWKYYQKNPFTWIEDHLLTSNTIEIIGIPKRISQLKYAGDLLNQQKNHSNTALILADEQLLSVALNSLSYNVESVNITMGLPLHITPAKDLFESLFKLINQSYENKSYYFEDIINFFKQPYIVKVLNNSTLQFDSYLQEHIINQQKLFITSDLINDIVRIYFHELNEELAPFFNNTLTSVKLLLNQINIFLEKLISFSSGLEREYLYRFLTIFKELEWLNETYVDVMAISTLKNLLVQLTKNEQLSFQGEPLSGLQIMGVLESRALDFETLIITGLNEGTLPKGSKDFSFIPFEIKMHFKLPTFIERDLIFSYHFFRLLQRSKKTYLIYNSETDALGASEKSRFLTQLEVINPQIKLQIISPKVVNNTLELKQIIKTPEVIEKIKTKFQTGISPSALASYIRNPIEFYQKYVLNIWEQPEIEETIEANTFGNIIHKTLELLFLPYLNKVLNTDSISEINLRKKEVLNQQFKVFYKQGDIETGKNRLLKEVAHKYIDKLIGIELDQIKSQQVIIKSLEQEFCSELKIEDLNVSINLKGNIDRVDVCDGYHRIIDYKTGKVIISDLNADNLNNLADAEKKLKAIQLMLYAYIYLKQEENLAIKSVQCGNISFKNLRQGYIKVNLNPSRGPADNELSLIKLEPFMNLVTELITEILNPAIPFIEKKVEFYKA